VAATGAPTAAYQAHGPDAAPDQQALLRALELSDDDFARIAAHCAAAGIEFLSTPFDLPSVALLADRLRVRRLKCPSGEITNGPLLLAMARTRRPIIVSTGMATCDEIADALAVLAFGYTSDATPSGLHDVRDAAISAEGRQALRDQVWILHCTSAYPAPVAEVNLHAMATLGQRFGLPVGYSDHTTGWHVSLAATALGAVCIEKHLTLDRRLPGPDHRASLEPDEMRALVAQAREVAQALGHARKGPTAAEREILPIARRRLVAAVDLEAGAELRFDRLTALRPAGGVSPMRVWDLQGTRASRAYRAGEPLDAAADDVS
jgi:N-acetylneuraminate synthase